ncbi:MAG TPA: aspartate kinase [Acidimicrobiia bacterium]|nr:aspartate kinase [Acidimicrobiia bacterium]
MLVVQKYGGTSVGSPERIRTVAERVARTRKAGDGVVVVVSAMGKATDELISLAREVTADPATHRREMDMLLTAGERISMALLAMAIRDQGCEAISFTGSQAGILTDTAHGSARIQEIRAFRVQESLDQGNIVIVAGFQGVSPDTKEVTTLGRGGSDATAVALAAALGADVCEIYTDVDGVFTADPRIVPEARKLDEVSFDEMLELAAAGAGVLMYRSVEFGRRFNVPIHVRSSFHDGVGTWVKESTMEEAVITGVAHDVSEAKLTVHGVPDRPGVASALFEPLAEAGVNVDMIVQNVSTEGHTDISFTVPREHITNARAIAEQVATEVEAAGVDVDEGIAKVALVGAGMKAHPGVAARMFTVLSESGINIHMISTSPIRVSCVIAADRVEQAVRALHEAFDPPMRAESG